MARRVRHRLTARQVATLPDGRYCDGGQLWLTVAAGRRAWTFRYNAPGTGRRRELGLGSARDVTLAEARGRATEARSLLSEGQDPLAVRSQSRRQQAETPTFAAIAERYITEQTPAWRDVRSAPIWRATLERHVYPSIGDRPIDSITTDDILSVLRPIWEQMTETATRIRGRLERILDYARSHQLATGENPARWRGHLANILPKPAKIAPVRHHPAIPYAEIAALMEALRHQKGRSALALRWLCLTGTRSAETRGALWSEVDLTAAVWTVPGHRRKTGTSLRIPLCNEALEILRTARLFAEESSSQIGQPVPFSETALIFSSEQTGRPLSDVAVSKAFHAALGNSEYTVHGLRSTLRDWLAEETDHPREVAEMTLGHAIGNAVEAAYRRGDLLEKRRVVMAEWGQYCMPNKS